jgi:hypothetical protein
MLNSGPCCHLSLAVVNEIKIWSDVNLNGNYEISILGEREGSSLLRREGIEYRETEPPRPLILLGAT